MNFKFAPLETYENLLNWYRNKTTLLYNKIKELWSYKNFPVIGHPIWPQVLWIYLRKPDHLELVQYGYIIKSVYSLVDVINKVSDFE